MPKRGPRQKKKTVRHPRTVFLEVVRLKGDARDKKKVVFDLCKRNVNETKKSSEKDVLKGERDLKGCLPTL